MKKRPYDVVFYIPFATALLTNEHGVVSGGAETQIVLLAGALANRGARVAVIVNPPDVEISNQHGFDVIVRARPRGDMRLVGKIYEAFAILSALSRARSRVVVTRVAGVQVGLVGLAAKLLGRRFVYSSANDFDFDPTELRLGRRDWGLYRLGIRLADEVVVQTDHQRRLCAEQFDRTSVVARSIAEPEELGSRSESFLWVGRLVSYKRPLAYVELARALPEARFRMVGVTTSETESLADEVRRAAVSVPNLELLDPMRRHELLDLIERSVAIVCTSEHEGMSNVLLEGWSRGVPAISLSHDPDGVIQSHGLGEFTAGSDEKMVAAAKRLWQSRADMTDVGNRSLEYVRTAHSVDAVADTWSRVILFDPADVNESFSPETSPC